MYHTIKKQSVGIGDRHADQHINRWLYLLEGMEINNLSIGHALKRNFYADWLKFSNKPAYRHYSSYLMHQFATPRSSYFKQQPADIVSLYLSAYGRELVSGINFKEKLESYLLAYLYPNVTPVLTITGITNIVQNYVKQGSSAHILFKRFKKLSPNIETIRKEFDLPVHFSRWFDVELSRVIHSYINFHDVLRHINPKVLVSTNDNLYHGYLANIVAKQLNIKTIVIQHGFIGQEWLFYPLWADQTCVWGEVEYDWYCQRGVNPNRVVITGNPRGIDFLQISKRKEIRQTIGINDKDKLIIWFTTPQGGNWLNDFARWLNHSDLVNMHAKVILKLHPTEKKSQYTSYIDPSIPVFESKDLDLASAFVAADAIIHDHSSIGAEASSCGQNVICAAVSPPYPSYYKDLIGSQHYAETPSQLAKIIAGLPSPNLTQQTSDCQLTGGEKAFDNIVKLVSVTTRNMD